MKANPHLSEEVIKESLYTSLKDFKDPNINKIASEASTQAKGMKYSTLKQKIVRSEKWPRLQQYAISLIKQCQEAMRKVATTELIWHKIVSS